ncbi:MAG: MBL fold metallo-hydrolase [Halieaceae bacterium]|jgi:ribonuclease Z|nr:MBL fold metallo-hydrolase [Halieaceae bacterium]
MKKWGTGLVVMALAAVIGFGQRATIAEKLVATALPQQMAMNQVASLEDGLHVVLCGAGGPMPAPRASGPCVGVVANNHLFIVDTGTDSTRNLQRLGYPPAAVEAVFLTHFHSDHIDGLGELATIRWATGDHSSPLPVYGPEGVDQIVTGFNAAYAQDFVYRHAHHGDEVAPLAAAGMNAIPFNTPADGELTKVYERDGVIVEALRVQHAPVSPAVGYLFSYGDRTVLISGDTARSDNITRFAKDVDLLVHEALAPNIIGMMEDAANKMGNAIIAKIMFDVPDYHASPTDAAETAKDAGVGHLLYYHVVPPIVVPGQEALWLNGAGEIFPDYTVGYDGVSFSLPANSEEIIKTHDGL